MPLRVHRFFVPNSLDNYNHIIWCDSTHKAVVVDPFDQQQVLQQAQLLDVELEAVLLTHSHGDHQQGAKLLGLPTYHWQPSYYPVAAESCIGLNTLSHIKVGDHPLFFAHTPGHMADHVIFFDETKQFLISGDLLFNAGVGHARVGNVKDLFQSIEGLKSLIPAHTKIYPAHNYGANNLKFAQSVVDTLNLDEWFAAFNQQPDQQPITEFSQERLINLFLNCDDQNLQERLQTNNAFDCFQTLRKLRDNW